MNQARKTKTHGIQNRNVKCDSARVLQNWVSWFKMCGLCMI